MHRGIIMMNEIYKAGLTGLVGADLSAFKVEVRMEVYSVNEDGMRTGSVGYFKNPQVAMAHIEMLGNKGYYKSMPRHILTDGIIAFLINNNEDVKLFDDDAEVTRLQQEIRNRLTPEMLAVLGMRSK